MLFPSHDHLKILAGNTSVNVGSNSFGSIDNTDNIFPFTKFSSNDFKPIKVTQSNNALTFAIETAHTSDITIFYEVVAIPITLNNA